MLYSPEFQKVFKTECPSDLNPLQKKCPSNLNPFKKWFCGFIYLRLNSILPFVLRGIDFDWYIIPLYRVHTFIIVILLVIYVSDS